jgi:hypothetical protein
MTTPWSKSVEVGELREQESAYMLVFWGAAILAVWVW